MTYIEFINDILNTRGRFACGDEYHERHHITPKCMGGTNDNENLIDLFAREHYIAHLLLAKIYNTYGMYAAVIYMHTGRFNNRKFKFNSRLYQKIREEFA